MLQIIAGPAKSDGQSRLQDTRAAANTEDPAVEFSRIRSWIKYGMKVRQIAEHYGAEIEEIGELSETRDRSKSNFIF